MKSSRGADRIASGFRHCAMALCGRRGDGRCRKRRKLSRIAARHYREPPTATFCIFSRARCRPISSMPSRKTCWQSCKICTIALDQQESTLSDWPDSPSKDRICAALAKARNAVSQIVEDLGAAARMQSDTRAAKATVRQRQPASGIQVMSLSGQPLIVSAGFLPDQLSDRGRPAVFPAADPLDAARIWQPRGLRVGERRRGF